MSRAADEAARAPHWASLREAGLSAGLWFLYGVYRCGGRWLYHLMLWPVAFYFALTRKVARRASVDYLERVGVLAHDAPLATRWWQVTRHIERFADALLDKVLAWTGALDLASARLDIDPHFEAAVAAGRGGVLVVAHCGNLEVLRALAVRLPTLRLKILVHTLHAQRFNRLLKRLNPASAANLLQVTELDAVAAAELSHCVSSGEFVVIAADRIPVSGQRAHTLDVPFLGRPAPLPVGPWVLAAALGCPVYWLSCLKHEGCYTLQCELLFDRIEMRRTQRTSVLLRVMTVYAQRLEEACRAVPYAWFNFYPFWAAPAAGRA
ncbi:MAG TPA: acyltransferase [Burkholderiaceae bacterium]|nr:acyltransferase [Burkholderiaceae bacterium]